jgi:hypothetical protein
VSASFSEELMRDDLQTWARSMGIYLNESTRRSAARARRRVNRAKREWRRAIGRAERRSQRLGTDLEDMPF